MLLDELRNFVDEVNYNVSYFDQSQEPIPAYQQFIEADVLPGEVALIALVLVTQLYSDGDGNNLRHAIDSLTHYAMNTFIIEIMDQSLLYPVSDQLPFQFYVYEETADE